MILDDENKITEVVTYQVMDEETDKEIKEWVTRWELEVEHHKKRIKRFKIFTIILFAFVLSIIVAGFMGIFFPQYHYIINKYLFVCNLLSAGLSVWSMYTMVKTKLIKERIGKWLFGIGIFAICINLFSAYGNFFAK
jgi:hypothetical protein